MSNSNTNYPNTSAPYDPGWNDPPKMGYVGSPRASGTKLDLKKRVAFPLQGLPAPTPSPLNRSAPPLISNTPPPNVGAPPPVSMSPLHIPSVQPNIPICTPHSDNGAAAFTAKAPNDELPENEQRDFVLAELEKQMSEFEAREQSESLEIRKRIDMLKTTWLEDKLEANIRKKLYEIGLALSSRQYAKANEILRALTIEHGSVCTHWGSALRQIIASRLIEMSANIEPLAHQANKFFDPSVAQVIGDNPHTTTLSPDKDSLPSKFGKIQHL